MVAKPFNRSWRSSINNLVDVTNYIFNGIRSTASCIYYDKLPLKNHPRIRQRRRRNLSDFRWEERTLENEIVITSGVTSRISWGHGWIRH